jgi:hypothetical protein
MGRSLSGQHGLEPCDSNISSGSFNVPLNLLNEAKFSLLKLEIDAKSNSVKFTEISCSWGAG